MRNIFQITVLFFMLVCSTIDVLAQEKTISDVDRPLKEQLYKKYRRQVLAYDKNKFDTLFFDFIKAQNAQKTLTKEEFYTYTVKIAIYSEKLGLLYKDKKEESQKTKEEWLARSYTNYLNSKK
jgi:hypothetical protein